MNILSLPAILSLTINFSVAMVVLMDRPKAAAHRLFFAFIIAFALWNLGEILMINSASIPMALAGAHLISLGFFLTPSLFLLITFHFPGSIAPGFARRLYSILIPAVPLFLLLVSLPQPVMSILQVPALGNIYFHALPSLRFWAFDGLIAVSAVYLAWGVRNLLLSRRRAHSQRQRTQALLLIAGFLAIELLAASVNLLRSLYLPRRSFFFLSTGISIVISVFFAVAILRYRLVNLRRFLRRGLVYSMLSAIVLSVYFLLIRHAAVALSVGFGIHSVFFEGLFILLLVILIRPIENHIDQMLERIVFSRRMQLRRQIADFSRSLLRYSSFDSFLQRLEELLVSISGAAQAGILIREAETGKTLLHSNGKRLQLELQPESPVYRYIAASDSPIEIEELQNEVPDDEAAASFAALGCCLLLPLRFDGSLLGMVALGHKNNGSEYTIDELEFFGLLANEVSIALSRNLAIEESRAKEAQLRQAEKLATMGRLVAGVAHEIRNPLNVISSAAQTLVQKRLARQERQELLRFIIEETEHLNSLLSDFLRLARPRQVQPTHGRVDKLLARVARAVAPQAGANAIEIVTPRIEAEVQTDFQMLEQALLNLAINAIEAMPQGGTLTLGASLSVSGWLTVQVADTGPGIPLAVQERIFEPFFTTRADGTGLGLSITYTLVEALGGRLSFQTASEGTTFSIRIPIEIQDGQITPIGVE
jgi:signal transduction histidine kinase